MANYPTSGWVVSSADKSQYNV